MYLSFIFRLKTYVCVRKYYYFNFYFTTILFYLYLPYRLLCFNLLRIVICCLQSLLLNRTAYLLRSVMGFRYYRQRRHLESCELYCF